MSDNQYQTYLTERDAEPAKKKRGLWATLSTMKFAIWVLIVLGALSLAAMILGELYPPEALRRGQGIGTDLLRVFGMENPFRSWWYRLLLGVLCLSLFACILERTPIVWRLWSKRPSADIGWLKSMRSAIVHSLNMSPAVLDRHLHGFRWRLKTDAVWVGERGRLGMWGPLFTHAGMLMIGLGAFVSSIGGVDQRIGGFAGDILDLEGMPFSVKVDSFRVQYYPLQPGQWVMVDGMWIGRLMETSPEGEWTIQRMGRESGDERIAGISADRIRNRFNSEMDRANIKRYAAYVTVLENGEEVAHQEIAVNAPLRRHGFRIYQSSYDPDHPRFVASFDSLRLLLFDSATGLADTITLRLNQDVPVPRDTLNVAAAQLLPHFKLGRGGAYSETEEFINPAVQLVFRGAKGYEKTQWVFLKFPTHEAGPGRYAYSVVSLHGERASAELMTILEVRKSNGGIFLWLGFIVGTIGLLLSSYVAHRMIYIEWPSDERSETKITGLTRKTVRLYERELDTLMEKLRSGA